MLKLKLDHWPYDFDFSVTQRYNHLDQRRDYLDNNKLQ